MFPKSLERRIQYLALFCVISMTLVITPWATWDPINLPKLLILGISGFTAIGNLLPYLKPIVDSEAKFLVYSLLLFLAILLIVLIANGSGFWAQVYGVYGRNTGLLAYVALALMLLSVALVSDSSFSRKLIWALIITGMVNAIYGFIQWLGIDPVKWDVLYSPIVGTLGNPNFISAHLGIASLASLSLALESSSRVIYRSTLLVNVGLSLFVIFKTGSSQGLLIFALVSTLIFYLKFFRSLNLVIRLAYWLLVLGGALLGTIGILNKGPLATLFYQESVTYRGDYWRAGWRMTRDNPLFGVGLDSYGDWYRFARSEAAALRRGPDVTSDSAHNVFLDISSSGGLFLLAVYLLILGLVLKSAIGILRKSQGFDAISVALASAWTAYIIQSAISINQLGLVIWGWVLGGAIIGYDIYINKADAPIGKNGAVRRGGVPPSVALTGTLGLLIGVGVSIWPIMQDISFRDAIESRDSFQIERVTDQFPRGGYYYTYAGLIFQENNLEEKALIMARKAIELNPRDFKAWRLLTANRKISQEDKDEAIAKMKELDPFNSTLGK